MGRRRCGEDGADIDGDAEGQHRQWQNQAEVKTAPERGSLLALNIQPLMPDRLSLDKEKAAQKTFAPLEPGCCNARGPDSQKSFCFFFFRKSSGSFPFT
jgi:hypothetical protein